MNAFATSPDLASDNFLPTDKNYRMTGEMPVEKEETDEEILAQQESEVDPPEPSDLATESGKDADLPTAPAQRKGKTKEDTRREFEKLTTHNRELKARLDALEAAQKTPTEAKTTAPPPVTESKEPQMADFATMGEYLTAARKYDRELAKQDAKSEWDKAQAERNQAERVKAIQKAWNDRVEPARQKYADFDEVAHNESLDLKEGSIPDVFILDSEHGPEMLYYLGQNPDKLAAINAMHPLKQARELFTIEQQFAAKPETSAPAVTKAPRPPNQVSGKGTVSASATEKAVEDGDFEAYQKAENAKALARLNKRK